MKKLHLLTLIIALTMAGSHAEAQVKQRYTYTANLEAFAGTWVYQGDGETFTLVIKKGRENTGMSYGDRLIGGYKLVKDGIVVYDDTQNLPDEITDDNFGTLKSPGFHGTNGCSRPDCVTPDMIYFYFFDSHRLSLNGVFRLQTPTTARFTVERPEMALILEEGREYEVYEITVPQDVILTKVE